MPSELTNPLAISEHLLDPEVAKKEEGEGTGTPEGSGGDGEGGRGNEEGEKEGEEVGTVSFSLSCFLGR